MTIIAAKCTLSKSVWLRSYESEYLEGGLHKVTLLPPPTAIWLDEHPNLNIGIMLSDALKKFIASLPGNLLCLQSYYSLDPFMINVDHDNREKREKCIL